MKLRMRSIAALAVVFFVVSTTGAEIRVVKRYVNYFDPEGKRPVVKLDDLPVPKRLNLPYARRVDPGYPNGTQAVHAYHIVEVPGTKRILRISFVGAYQGDTLPGFMDWKMWYQVSNDGGKTMSDLKPIIQQGEEYNLLHPIRPVQIGKNSFCPSTAPPMVASNGEIMVPFYFPPLDKDGKYYNPVGAYTFSDGGVMIARWNEDGSDVTWDLGQTVRLEADQSTRGVGEPALIELNKRGKFLMVIRASNHKRESTVPGYKYLCISNDYCRTWLKPRPMTYSDGQNFFSAAACSELIRSVKNGKLYWIGNIAPGPAKGNIPRYPLVIGEIDEGNSGLIRQSVVTLDDRNPKIDSPAVQFSNFTTIQNPKTGQIVVKLARIDAKRVDPKTGSYAKTRYPPCAYVIEVD